VSVLCLVELDAADAVPDASLRALALARGLAAGADGAGPLLAVTFGPAARLPLDVLGAAGVSEVYAVEPDQLAGYAPRAWARVLAGLAGPGGAAGLAGEAGAGGAGVVLAAATDRGSEVLAYLGAITGQPVAANCLEIAPAPGGAYRLVRQRWAGLLLEDAVLAGSPALATVSADAGAAEAGAAATGAADAGAAAAGAADAGAAAAGTTGEAAAVPAGARPVVHQHKPELTEADLRVRAAVSADQGGGVSLATARVVVGGGRGVGGPDGFAPLEELAALLGGVVGVSRVVTSQGWRPHTQQVGQTGTKITPELYLACGISGAIQHMAGCGSAKHIIAVNTDPAAPIMSRADYAVIGDLGAVIPALVAALRERG
jgi:electron transfer flavoprotein alpha subunit